MTQHRFDVIFDCGDGMGVLPVFATDARAAWATARHEFPNCNLALVDREFDEAEQHRIEYNTYKPHSVHQGRTPLQVIHQCKAA